MRKQTPPTVPPIKYLLECSDNEIGNFELVKLSEVANLRREMLERFDRLVDVSAQAVLAAWLRTIDREDLKRQLLESSTVTLEKIMGDAREKIRNQGRSPEELEYDPMPGPGFLLKLPPEEKRRRNLDSKKCWEERQLAAGKCRSCSAPICRESVDLCTKHLAMKREAQRKRKRTIHAHGRHPNTLAALKEASEKRRKSH